MAHYRHNHSNDNDDVESDKDEDYTASPIHSSSDDDHRMVTCDYAHVWRMMVMQVAHQKVRMKQKKFMVSKEYAYLRDESEDNKENSDSDSISPQDTETKQQLQMTAIVFGIGEKRNKNAAIHLVQLENQCKTKDYGALVRELDEDHFKNNLREIVGCERSPQIRGPVRNLVAALHKYIMAIKQIFKKGKEEAEERVLDILDCTEPQQKQCFKGEHINQYELFSQFELKRKVHQFTICRRKTLTQRKKKLRSANVELNKIIQLQIELKSSRRIYQLCNQLHSEEHIFLQRQNTNEHNRLPEEVSLGDVPTSQKCCNLSNSQEQLLNNDHLRLKSLLVHFELVNIMFVMLSERDYGCIERNGKSVEHHR
ncbi:MAG: hypothetical protein EZS28_023818 [Streblomastix strix]|uniref:Uncharacterized protein n=1 Tax=Streblomastix strix TaxID=222440 RepID=A0A5J4VDU8_9EUKA|nr:MAG: hypothetical protein EZS28_023818 [Streblomastix strix]